MRQAVKLIRSIKIDSLIYLGQLMTDSGIPLYAFTMFDEVDFVFLCVMKLAFS